MGELKKAWIGTLIMYGGFVLAMLLTFLFGRAFPIVGIVGLFVALGGYGLAYSGAKCPECRAEWLYGPRGFPLLFILPVCGTYRCPECGHTIESADYR